MLFLIGAHAPDLRYRALVASRLDHALMTLFTSAEVQNFMRATGLIADARMQQVLFRTLQRESSRHPSLHMVSNRREPIFLERQFGQNNQRPIPLPPSLLNVPHLKNKERPPPGDCIEHSSSATHDYEVEVSSLSATTTNPSRPPPFSSDVPADTPGPTDSRPLATVKPTLEPGLIAHVNTTTPRSTIVSAPSSPHTTDSSDESTSSSSSSSSDEDDEEEATSSAATFQTHPDSTETDPLPRSPQHSPPANPSVESAPHSTSTEHKLVGSSSQSSTGGQDDIGNARPTTQKKRAPSQPPSQERDKKRVCERSGNTTPKEGTNSSRDDSTPDVLTPPPDASDCTSADDDNDDDEDDVLLLTLSAPPNPSVSERNIFAELSSPTLSAHSPEAEEVVEEAHKPAESSIAVADDVNAALASSLNEAASAIVAANPTPDESREAVRAVASTIVSALQSKPPTLPQSFKDTISSICSRNDKEGATTASNQGELDPMPEPKEWEELLVDVAKSKEKIQARRAAVKAIQAKTTPATTTSAGTPAVDEKEPGPSETSSTASERKENAVRSALHLNAADRKRNRENTPKKTEDFAKRRASGGHVPRTKYHSEDRHHREHSARKKLGYDNRGGRSGRETSTSSSPSRADTKVPSKNHRAEARRDQPREGYASDSATERRGITTRDTTASCHRRRDSSESGVRNSSSSTIREAKKPDSEKVPGVCAYCMAWYPNADPKNFTFIGVTALGNHIRAVHADKDNLQKVHK